MTKAAAPTFRKPFIRFKTPGIDCSGEEMLTKQNHKDECNINLIVAQYDRTGMLNHTNENPGQYTEVESFDFLESQLIVKNAEQMFANLPSKLRTKFNNQPGQFMDFVHDPNNVNEMIELGLAEAKKPKAPPNAESAPPSTVEKPAAEGAGKTQKPTTD